MFYRSPAPWPPIVTYGEGATITPLCPELEARVTALEAENARLTELTRTLVEFVIGQYESQQALRRIDAWVAKAQRKKRCVGP